MKNTYTIDIEAPPERVFYRITGGRLMKWLPNIVESENLKVTESQIGSTFRQVYLERGRRMEMHGEITGYEPNRRLTCEIRGDAFELWVDYRLEDLGGRTRLTQDSTVIFKSTAMKVMGVLMKPFMKKASLKQADDSFAKLKQLAELGDELPAV
jgi:uncharacterized protein YndB with AHSA1/START domain